VTGFGPQLKVMTPPFATALTTAAEVQLAGVPLPMTWFGWLVFTARATRGTDAWPFGFPAAGRACATATWVACATAGLGFGDAVFAVLFAAEFDASSAALCGTAEVEQAASARPAARVVIPTATPRMSRMGQMVSVPLTRSSSSSSDLGVNSRKGLDAWLLLASISGARLSPHECPTRRYHLL
jgi:hypothetical protein